MTPISPYRAARIRPSAASSPEPRRAGRLVLALLLAGLVILGSLALLPGERPAPAASSLSSPSGDVQTSAGSGRVATLWPFSRDSIWNLPIGANAVYVPGNIQPPTSAGMTTDPDVIIMTPNAPMTPVYYNSDGWGGGSRCNAQGGVLFNAPIPGDFVVPGASGSSTPNFATAILMADGHTLQQGQPMARCTANGTATMWWFLTNDLYGTGLYGGHGGSTLSSLGGTIRLGELVPGGVIRHALKINLDGAVDIYYDSATRGYRWPAKQADGCASSCYGGTTKALRMGALLALPSSIDVGSLGLETEPAKILARTFQDYGAYLVDDTAWSVYGIETEFGPQGRVEDEFQAAWSFPIDPASKAVPWARDMDRIFGALNVVDNWDSGAWATVSASNGTLGVGGGAPRVSWAPDFRADGIAPVSSASLSGSAGSAGWFLSSVSVSLSATDDSSGVAAIHFRTDGGAWQLYTAPFSVAGDGTHPISFYATDNAGNNEATRTTAVQIDSVAPSTSSSLNGTLLPDGSYSDWVTVILTPSDGTSGVQLLQYRLDGGPWRSYSIPVLVGGNGSHSVDYFATDHAGNIETTRSQALRITGSAVPPPPPAHLPPIGSLGASGTMGENGWYVSPVTVTLTATSASGTATSIMYRLDEASWLAYVGSFTIPEGRHVVAYQAMDVLGYVEPLKTATIDVDFTAPTIARASGGSAIAPGAPLSWTGSDGVSGIARYEVSIDGGPFVSVGSEPRTTGHWPEGSHIAVVNAYDAAGNEATTAIGFDVSGSAANPPSPSPLDVFPPGVPLVALGFLIVALASKYMPRRVAVRSRLRAA